MKSDGPIRPFVEDDIPQVTDLYVKIFRGSYEPSSPALRALFKKLYFGNPWYDETLPCLVYQGNRGKIIGFLGILPRRMRMNGRPIKVAVSNNFMVEPGNRHTLAGIQLLKIFFEGVQDISLAEGGNLSRQLWERFGGTTALLYSNHWIRPLRPCQYVTSLLRQWKFFVPLVAISRPLCRALDALAIRLPPNNFMKSAPPFPDEELDVATFLACLSDFAGEYWLYPEYDNCSLQWFLDFLAEKKNYGTLRKLVVRNQDQKIIGWYLYYVNPGGVSEVLQIGANSNSIHDVLDHLFFDAWCQGVVTLSGRLEPRFIKDFAARYCILKHVDTWMLIHSKKPELLDIIHRGDAFLTRLEGEWMFFTLPV